MTQFNKVDNCPICAGLIYNIKASFCVCKKHEARYLVTRCAICGKNCFSRYAGICSKCAK